MQRGWHNKQMGNLLHLFFSIDNLVFPMIKSKRWI